ncbi:hypothetical protein VTH82DRAFT_7480 [Thermothelomyces myriococcoides]
MFHKMMMGRLLAVLLALVWGAATGAAAFEYYTFDGPGFPSCHNVSRVYNATSVDDVASLVKSLTASNSTAVRVRAAGKGHMWYDTQCSDAWTVIVRTEELSAIWDLDLPAGAESGSVWVEAGVTFFQLAEYLHERGASVGYTLTNWNISFGGSVAMGAHRSSIREESMVAAGVLAMDIWWPYKRKFHQRYYDVVPANSTSQEGFQNTFSVTELEAVTARTILDSGKYLATSNMLAEEIFFGLWSKPNFREKKTNEAIEEWPVYGWNYDVLIGGLYPDQKAEWEYGLAGYTLELAFPVTMANRMLKRVRELFDDELKKGIVMTSTYRSGINIKFGKAYYDLLGQVTYNTSDGADWTKGAIMFDFPSYRPTIGDHKRFNEPFSNTLIDEFPCRPHWTKNTREVFARSVKNFDPDHLRRFNEVRKRFDPNGIYRSVVGEILGFY